MKNDDAYRNAAHIPDGDSYPDRWAVAAREFRDLEAAVGRARLNDPYGREDRQRTDFFYPAGRPAGLAMFVHGGYWMESHRSDWSHLAAGATARGWVVAVPSYPLAPDATVAGITHSIARALGHAADRVSGPIRLAGHSAGGHLVARMLCRDVALPPGLEDRLQHVLAISPLGDLRPLLDTTMNRALGLDPDGAAAESPALATDRRATSVTAWVGADERPAFLEQARGLAAAWTGTRLVVEPGRHHFDVIDGLADPNSAMTDDFLG